jgi:lon-related putative ATP-dependent protease
MGSRHSPLTPDEYDTMQPGEPLSPAELYRHCDIGLFDFETTRDLEHLAETLGQDRAVEAIHFSIGMATEGYNLFVLGPPGSGKHSVVRGILEQQAAEHPVPDDWCYVNNFGNPKNPQALRLPAGRGTELRRDIAQLIQEAYSAIPAAFESEDYQNRQQAIEEEFKEYQEKAFEEVQQHARERGIGIIQTPTGIAFAPLHNDKAISPKEYEKLPEDEQEKLSRITDEVSKELQRVMQSIPQEARRMRAKIRELDREVSMYAVGGLISQLIEKYAALPGVVGHLRDMQADIVDNVDIFLRSTEQQHGLAAKALVSGRMHGMDAEGSPAMRRYAVNVIIDHTGDQGAPVIYEDYPTFPCLIGQIEHMSEMGTLVTNYHLIRAGALHRANGGYLVVDAIKLLFQPFAWEGLKRALMSREIRIKSLGEALSLVSTVSLEPAAIPLDVKVVLIGERLLYYLLQAYDPEFLDLFKVAADFDDQIDRTPENTRQFARLLATLAARDKLKPLDRSAAARLLEECARHAGDAEKISAQTRHAADILRESDYYAGRNGREVIGGGDVQHAIDARIRRASRIRDRLQEEILRDTILIDTEGGKIGQVNGLAVAQLGEFAFAHPSRITARVSQGSGEVVDIEREVELGGPIHSKGVLILTAFLASHFVIDRPLSLYASLVFEQSYGGIEGDSASAAELCALLSALARVPLNQGLAITGSVNQHGEIQAIGGVNEKIEGFFDICSRRGLTGTQGVLIPVANVKHLMLRGDVIESVAQQRFHVYPVDTIDRCLGLLTGLEAGERGEDGGFTAGSVNQRVRQRLLDFAETRRAFAAGGAHSANTDARN